MKHKELQAKLTKINPFNIGLLNLNEGDKYKLLQEVTSSQMFEGANYNLHPDGLWSTRIFGEVGSPERKNNQAYINLKVTVLHPMVYRELISSSSLIDEVMAGKAYVVFNKETKFFDKSNPIDGHTGMEYLMSKIDEIKIPDTGSPKRRDLITLLEKNKGIYKVDKVPVLQAFYRDVEFKDGSVSHDEVNQIYRELLNLSSSIQGSANKEQLQLLDSTRYNIQKALLKLYLYLGDITGNGKKKLVQGKWASRTVFSGTANVITSSWPSGRYIGDPRNIGFMDSVVGLHQQMVAHMPYAIRGVRESFLKDMFIDPIEPVPLVNKKTLKKEMVYLSQEWFDLFTSVEGIRKLIQKFKPVTNHHRDMEIDGRYLALIYKGPDGTFKIMNGIEELPEGRSDADVHPITFMELMYISTCHLIDGAPTNTVRYPITGIESNVICRSKLFTTVKSEKRVQLDQDWKPDELVKPFYQFPIRDSDTITSYAPPVSALPGLGGDHDGDRMSHITAQTTEAVEEANQYLSERRAYVGPDGKLRYSVGYDTIEFVCKNLMVIDPE